jgi:glucose/arabinose dehydrogenase
LRRVNIRRSLPLAALCSALVVVPAAARPTEPAGARASFGLVKVADGLRSPVYVAAAPGDKRLFAVEQEGTIRTVSKGKVAARPYADLRRFVTAGGERGLLSVAFHPKFASNGKLYVYFTNKGGNEEIWELHARKGAASIRPGHRKLLEIADPEGNHNGGQLQFGPDGMLYFGDGDGGGGGDQHGEHGNGQNPANLLGKLGRIDVDTRTGGKPYGIPKDNPFVGQSGWAPEIWALGLRNPWRFSFDRANGDLWIGDVGQNAWEEVDHVKRGLAGVNYGWNRYEGRHDFASDTPIVGGKLRGPVAEYSHNEGCSITGGYVYRGPRIPGLSGRYVYADYCSGKMWTLGTSGGAPRDVSSVAGDAGLKSIVSFGQDGSGILYVCSAEGTIYRFVSR